MLIVGFISKDPDESWTIPGIIFVAGIFTLLATLWSHVKSLGDKKNILISVAPKVRHIIYVNEQQIQSLASAVKKLKLVMVKYPNETQIRSILKELNPRSNSFLVSIQNGNTINLNWIEYMYQMNEVTLEKSDIYFNTCRF
jgi:hypothetical protein